MFLIPIIIFFLFRKYPKTTKFPKMILSDDRLWSALFRIKVDIVLNHLESELSE